MSRKKSLGAANMDGVPNDELILAEMIANAEEHELGFTTGDHNMVVMEETDFLVPCSDRACAIGAYVAFKLCPSGLEDAYTAFEAMTGVQSRGVWNGNDGYYGIGDGYDIGDDIGAAYRAYHLDE